MATSDHPDALNKRPADEGLSLDELSESFATARAAVGVRMGDRVAIHLPNCPHFAIAYYGISRIGGVFTPLSPVLAPREVWLDLLRQMDSSGDQDNRRYLLAVLLLRKRIVRLVSSPSTRGSADQEHESVENVREFEVIADGSLSPGHRVP